ncbi:MAG: hypothetical protein QOG04_177 [Actinomycetota bacterium]|jgi:hypothetical protein|nr:hypothetical protein [Actinomycetota bacterium]
MGDQRQLELEGLLDDLSYAITSARTTGLGEAEQLRVIARRIRDISSNIDSLAGSIVAEKQAAEG